jgi:DNA-binding transcriptional ArsR family regulator
MGKAMDTKTHARYEARARIIKAMSHPTRLFVVDELFRHGEHCVCELTEMVGVDMSTISRHLAILRSAGLVEDQKRGTQVYYRARIGCIVSFLECVDSLVKSNARAQRETLSS